MADEADKLPSSSGSNSPFEQIRRVNAAGNEHWSSRDFAKVLELQRLPQFRAGRGKGQPRLLQQRTAH